MAGKPRKEVIAGRNIKMIDLIAERRLHRGERRFLWKAFGDKLGGKEREIRQAG